MFRVTHAGRRDRQDLRAPRCSRRALRLLALAVAGGAMSSCATTAATVAGPAASPPVPGIARSVARFDQQRDTFAFANLVRAERPGLNDGFANYCLIMTRAASQFFRVARFEPEAPRVSPAEYTRLAREVLATHPWAEPRVPAARIPIPGYPDLHAFSRAQETAIKAAFGWNVPSMVDWRTWRVGVAFSRTHQARLLRELLAEIDAGRPTPVMITNFPSDDLLNHAVLVYGRRPASPTAPVVELLAYDPNDPGTALSLFFDREQEAFWVGPLTYSPPGPIRAFRLYTSFLF